MKGNCCLRVLTKKPVQFDHVQLEVMNEAVDIEEVAHQSHQAVSYRTQLNILTLFSQ